MVGLLNDDWAGRAVMKAGGAPTRNWHVAYAGCVDGMSWLQSRPIEPPTISPITAERQQFSGDRAAASPVAPTALSLLAHAAALLGLMLLLPGRAELPDLPTAVQVALVFEPAPTVPPSATAVAPAAAHDMVPTQTEPSQEAKPTIAPTPPPVPQPAAVPAPVPQVPFAPAPLPATSAPVHITRFVPKTASPPARPPSPMRQAAVRPLSAPARKPASLTPPPPAPADVPSAEISAAPAAVAASLIPPRPVAGMATDRAPAYPKSALRRDEAGRVMLRVSVSADGRPLEVDVARSSGYPILDSAALSAVREWRFIPAMQAGRAVAAIAEVPVRFRIDN